MQDSTKPILIMTWGNPSRGDDALGTLVHDRLQEDALPDVELITDFQLQIEHTLDMLGRERIVFVDAAVSANAPFDFSRLYPARDDSYTTHAMSPQSLLTVFEKTQHEAPPPCYMLSIRGYEFGLGLALSDQAASNLADAHAFLRQLATCHLAEDWDTLVDSRNRSGMP